MKVLIALNSAWNLLNFRAGLIKALVADGHMVVLAAPGDEHVLALKALGARFVHLPMRTHGTNPVADLGLLWRFMRLLRAERPDVLLGYTAKTNVYGSLAAHALGIPVINNIAGLGSVFIRGGWLARVLQQLYRLALARSRRVFFQNPDDLQLFLSLGLVAQPQTALLPGSGVDLHKFQRVPLSYLQGTAATQSAGHRRFVFLLLRKRFALEPAERIFWTWMAWGALGFVVLLYVSPSSTAVDRVALYWIPLQLFVWSRVPDALGRPGGVNVFWVYAVVGYSAAVHFVWLFFATHSHFWLPYQFYPWVWLWR